MASFENELHLLTTSESDSFSHICRLFNFPLWIIHTALGEH